MAVQNNGGEFQEYQSAQNQLLNIQAQQMQNLNEQRVMAQADASTNNVLYQASGLMADNMMNNTQEAANFNPQTQAILNQYGLGQPRMQRSSSSSSQSTSKQNITINNNYKTENTTTNNVTVPSGGPIQGRPITMGDNGIGKFKVWLNTTFAQQQETAAKRDREYEIRQSSLSKENNKILRKLETVGTNVGKALDPRRVAQAIQNPMKMLLTTLGIVTIAQNFPKIVDFVDKVQNFTKPGGTLVQALGGKQNENVGQALVNLFFNKEDGLIAPIKQFFVDAVDRRKKVIQKIELPNINWPLLKPGRAIKEVGKYLGSIIKAFIDPGQSVIDNASEVVSETANENLKNYQQSTYSDYLKLQTYGVNVKDHKGEESNEIVYAGDRAVMDNRYSGIPEYAIDETTGKLSGTAGSTVANGNDLVRLFNELNNGKYIDPTAITESLTRFADVIESGQKIIIGEKFKNFLKDTFNLDIGTKTPEGEYIYVSRKVDNIATPFFQLVNKNNKKRSDKSVIDYKPGNLYEVSEEELMKIVSSISGKREKVNDLGEIQYIDFKLDDIKNTNKALQEGTLKYIKTINPEANITSFYNNAYDIEQYNRLVEKQEKNMEKLLETNRATKAWESAKSLFNMSDNLQKAFNYFINDLKMTDEQAAGFIANLIAESSLNPKAEGKDKNGKPIAQGIAQWTNTGNRRDNLLKMYNEKYKTNFSKVTDMPFEDQLKLLGLELTEGGKNEFYKKFINGEYIQKEGIDSVEAVLRGFEFGGNGNLAEREQIETNVNGTKVSFDDMYATRLATAKDILKNINSSWVNRIYETEKATDVDESTLDVGIEEANGLPEFMIDNKGHIKEEFKNLDINIPTTPMTGQISSNQLEQLRIDDDKVHTYPTNWDWYGVHANGAGYYGIQVKKDGSIYRNISTRDGWVSYKIYDSLEDLKKSFLTAMPILEEVIVKGNNDNVQATLSSTGGAHTTIVQAESYTK